MSDKPMTHIGMARRAATCGWRESEWKEVRLRETPKCWINADDVRWKKEGDSHDKARSYSTTDCYGHRNTLKLDTVRLMTRDELRAPFKNKVKAAGRRFDAAQAKLEEAEQKREEALQQIFDAKAELAKFDKKHPTDV